MSSSARTWEVTVFAAERDWRLLWYSLALVGILLVGAIIIALVDRWRKRKGSDLVATGDQLTYFRELYEQGELSREEYEKIRLQLGGEMRKALDLPDRSTSPEKGVTDVTMPQDPESRSD